MNFDDLFVELDSWICKNNPMELPSTAAFVN